MRPLRRSRAKALIEESISKRQLVEASVEDRKRKAEKILEQKNKGASSKVTINRESVLKSNRMTTKEKHFYKLLEDEKFSEFNKYDWLEYFKYKASKHSINYRWNNYMKESQVMAGLLNKFEPNEIKLMIDFLWDCDHQMFIGKVLGIYMLSEAWGSQNSIYQNALMWKQGKFKNVYELKKSSRSAPKRNRNWIDDSETSDSDGVTITI